MARDIDPGLTQTAIRRSPPAHNHGCGSWVCPCHGVDTEPLPGGCELGTARSSDGCLEEARRSLGFSLRTWWRGASTRAVADVGSSSNSRSGIESSGSPCAPCVTSATPSASAASSPSLAEANGAFGASSLTAAPEWLYDFGRKTGRYPAKILDYEKKQGAGYNGHETACAIVTYHE